MSNNQKGPVAEIERKWLLKKLPDLPFARKREIWHYYVPEGRVTRDIYPQPGGSTKTKYVHCVKKPLGVQGGNSEDEREISFEDFIALTAGYVRDPLRKTRYDFEIGEKTWEVDVFTDICLIMAEVEWIFPLDQIDEEEVRNFTVPSEIEPLVILEVTGTKEFTNYQLSK